jgi:hypothetical protein
MTLPILDEIREEVAPNGIWRLDGQLEQILKRQILSLPSRNNLSDYEYRYPKDKASLRGFLDKFFARHFFQVQNAVLQNDCFENLVMSIKRGAMTIADIGSGPAVASLAILNLVSTICYAMNKNVRVNIILNDTASEALASGCVMLNRYKAQLRNIQIGRVLAIDTPFPESMIQLHRMANLFDCYDICSLSYVLIPLKEDGSYAAIQSNLQFLANRMKPNGFGIITQDKFRENLVRHIGSLLGTSVNKLSLRQKIYDSTNSCEELSYDYFRIVFFSESHFQSVNSKFCLQKYASMS